VKREQLQPYLERQIAKWSAKSYPELREELRRGYNAEVQEDLEYHVEVELLESCDDYAHVMVAVCSPRARWSCYLPLCASFLVYRDGRVEK